MAQDLTKQVIASPWKKAGSIYIFSDKPAEMVADSEDSALRDLIEEVEDIANSIFDKRRQEAAFDLVNRFKAYDHRMFMVRMRGVGAGLDQDEILEHIITMQKEYVKNNTKP